MITIVTFYNNIYIVLHVLKKYLPSTCPPAIVKSLFIASALV